MLNTGARFLSQGATASSLANTKCHLYIVLYLAAAQEFIQTKSTVSSKPCYQQAANICAETREILLAPNTRRIYISSITIMTLLRLQQQLVFQRL
jgi:hypothetical protein